MNEWSAWVTITDGMHVGASATAATKQEARDILMQQYPDAADIKLEQVGEDNDKW